MKKDWKIQQLKEVCDFQNGFAFKSKTFRDNGVPVLRISNIQKDKIDLNKIVYINTSDYQEDLSKYIVGKHDLLIAMSGATTGKIGFNQTDTIFYLNQRVGKFKPKKDLVISYLYYYLSTKVEESLKISAGSAQPNLSTQQIKSFKIPIPPLNEQKRIVAKLDKCFEAIDKAHSNVEKNLQNAKDLFQSHLNQIYSQKGEGWVEKKLGDICELTRGHNPPKKDFIYEPKVGYVRFYQIRDGWSDNYKVFVPENSKLHRVKERDILMVAYRHIGKRFRGVSGAFNVALCKITNINEQILDDDYLYYIIPTNFVRGELLKRSERSLIPSMSVVHLKNIEIPLPPIQQQKILVLNIKSLFNQTQSLESNYKRELNALDELKKSILQKAFNGEL
jgi:type I restriction enzyme, S subunit